MTKPALLGVAALMILSFALGALLTGQQQAAQAQEPAATAPPAANNGGEATPAPPATAAKDLLAPPAVVAATPYLTQTDYEQDPFEPSRLRRTETTVLKMVLVRADGTTQVKDVP